MRFWIGKGLLAVFGLFFGVRRVRGFRFGFLLTLYAVSRILWSSFSVPVTLSAAAGSMWRKVLGFYCQYHPFSARSRLS